MNFDHLASRACVYCKAEDELFLDDSTGDYICRNCARVQPERYIDTGREWREFDNDDDRSGDRQRAEAVDEDFGTLGTGISLTNFNSSHVSQAARTLNKYSKMVPHSRAEAYLHHVFARINDLGERLALGVKIRQTAKDIVKEFDRKRVRPKKGLKTDAFVAALLVLACKREKVARPLKDVATGTGQDMKDVQKFYKLLLRDADVGANATAAIDATTSMPVADQAAGISEVLCNRLAIPFSVAKVVRALAHASGSTFLDARRPASVAAAALVFVLEQLRVETPNFKDVAEASSVSLTTVRDILKDIRTHVDDLPAELRQLSAVSIP